MTDSPQRARRVLHSISYEQARGAELYARALIDELNRRDGPWLHEMVSIFEPERERPTAEHSVNCLLYTSPSPRDGLLSRMPSSA